MRQLVARRRTYAERVRAPTRISVVTLRGDEVARPTCTMEACGESLHIHGCVKYIIIMLFVVVLYICSSAIAKSMHH